MFQRFPGFSSSLCATQSVHALSASSARDAALTPSVDQLYFQCSLASDLEVVTPSDIGQMAQ